MLAYETRLQHCSSVQKDQYNRKENKKPQTNKTTIQKVLFRIFQNLSAVLCCPSVRMIFGGIVHSEAVGSIFLLFPFHSESGLAKNAVHHLKKDKLEMEAITKS